MLLEGGLLHAQRRLQLQQTASMEMSSGQKLKTKKSQISCSRNHCQKITSYDIKLDESIQKKTENFNLKHDSSGPTISKSELRTYSIL